MSRVMRFTSRSVGKSRAGMPAPKNQRLRGKGNFGKNHACSTPRQILSRATHEWTTRTDGHCVTRVCASVRGSLPSRGGLQRCGMRPSSRAFPSERIPDHIERRDSGQPDRRDKANQAKDDFLARSSLTAHTSRRHSQRELACRQSEGLRPKLVVTVYFRRMYSWRRVD